MKKRISAHSNSTTSERSLHRLQFEIAKSYLFRVHSKQIVMPHFTVNTLYGLESPHSPRPKQVTVSDELGGKFYRLTDSSVVALVTYQRAKYHVSMFSQVDRFGAVDFFIHVLGEDPLSGDAGKLRDYLLAESIAHSPHKNMTLLASSERGEGEHLELIEMEIRNDQLEDIFLPEATLRQVDLFVNAVTNFETCGRTLRLLFSGKPGTGKTKVIRAMAGLCRGKATFIFSNGSEERIAELFEMASMFSPAVVCIDDIDIMTGDRDEGVFSKRLATLLQHLDGFSERKLFVLATTNDKRLVDLAASRPGRFDRIIDVNVIAPEHYPALVRTKTENEGVLALFDDGIYDRFRRMRATGAFVANIVKHLEMVAAFDPDRLDREYVESSIREAERGFSQGDREEEIGFRAA